MPWYLLLPLRLYLAGHAPVVPAPLDWVRSLPAATVSVNAGRHEVMIELAPVDLQANAMHQMDMSGTQGMAGMNMDEHAAHNPTYPPVMGVDLPLTGWMSGFRIELVDSAGRPVPSRLLHHYNLIDPNHRELFLPISRRVLAAGSETGAVRLNRWLMGAPFVRGDRLVASAMLHNPTSQSYKGVRTRLILTYSADGHWYPLLRAYPWQFDVAFPVGDKAFNLPLGRSEKFYEGSPAVAGKIVGIGGHVHDHADSLVLRDVSSGVLIWRATPITDSTGHVVAMPIKKFIGITGVGVRIVPDHRYRVTVFYDNETGQMLPDGGMGVVAGLFMPAPNVIWPVADVNDSLYVTDLRHALRMGEPSPLSIGSATRTGVEHTHH